MEPCGRRQSPSSRDDGPWNELSNMASSALGLHSLIAIDGDGVDSDNDGKPDAKVNPDRIKIDSKGGIYIEQRLIFQSPLAPVCSLLR